MSTTAPGFVRLADRMGEDLSWHLDALCAETDPEIFFPDEGQSARAAKAICSRCPVRVECLDYALRHNERFGVWGGTSEHDRRRLRAEGAEGAA